MYKFKQLVLITSLVISGVSSAVTDYEKFSRSSEENRKLLIENYESLKKCERIIAPNYVLNPRSELETCIKDNSTELSTINTVPGQIHIAHIIDARNKKIAELHRAYDDAVTYQVLGRVAAVVSISAACLIAGAIVKGVVSR